MTSVTLPPVVDLAATAMLAETLRATDGAVAVDARAVERIGVAGLQMLLSARATAIAAGHALTIDAPSPALTAAATTAGATALLATALPATDR